MNKRKKQRKSTPSIGNRIQTKLKTHISHIKNRKLKGPHTLEGALRILTSVIPLTARELPSKDQIFFAKRLSFLLRSGVQVLESLMLIKEQTHKKVQNKILDSVIADVSNGQSLSTSLERSKRLFSTFAINIISIGEATGTLSENLDYLAEELKKRRNLKRKVIGAFIYPAIITLATIGITTFLVVYLFPKIMPIFVSLHMELPITTRVVIWFSNFLRNDGILFLTALSTVVLIFLIMLRKNTSFHLFVDRQALKTPVIGTIIRYYNLANTNRTLSLLLKSGVTLSDALTITSETSGNMVYRNEYQTLVEVVNRGERLSNYLRKDTVLFPDILTQIIAVGERSGDLENSLLYLAHFYENEVDDFTKNLSTVVEPVLMVCMGMLVGFIAISIITPIYGITQNLHT